MKTHIFLFAILFAGITQLKAQDITLPKPQTTGGKPLMEALNARKTSRDFSTKELSLQTISNLLWAANGLNRPAEGRKTAPSASNNQELDIYVFMQKGVYVYDSKDHKLILKKAGDHRSSAGKQDFVKQAPLVLTYVANLDKMGKYDEESKQFYSGIDCGFVSQNVYLFCASENLNTVVMGMVDRDQVTQVLELKNAKVLVSQTIGYPKEK